MKTRNVKPFITVFFFVSLFAANQILFAQNVKRIYTNLLKGEIEKADAEVNSPSKVHNLNDSFLLMLANCIITSTESYEKYDPIKSLEIYNTAMRLNPNKNDADYFLRDFNYSVEKISSMIRGSIIDYLEKRNSEELYQKAIEVCDKCDFIESLQLSQMISSYNKAIEENTVSGYEKFLQSYPDESIQYYKIIGFLEIAEFNQAKEIMTVASLDNFINKYAKKKDKFVLQANHIKDSLFLYDSKLQQEILAAKPNALKQAIVDAQIDNVKDNPIGAAKENKLSVNFPMKYYNGTQFFYQGWTDLESEDRLYVINSLLKTTHLDYGRSKDLGSIEQVGESQKTERFFFSPLIRLPSIKSYEMQVVGTGESSYNNKKYLATKTYKILNSGDRAFTQFVDAKILKFDDIFSEAPSINKVEVFYGSRLSNNNILIIFSVEIQYLSHILNSMFGIDGGSNFSRRMEYSKYFKFLVISEDGSRVISNNNYLIPIERIRPIDNGFVILSNKLSELIKIDNNMLGKESIVYSKEQGKYIKVTEGIGLNDNIIYEDGIKLFKFDNHALLVKELIVDNPTDRNIKKPLAKYIQHSENYLCLYYDSYNENVVNVRTPIVKIFDFDMNLIAKRILGGSDYQLTSMNDKFYYIYNGSLHQIWE